jgi:hypothetical protein
MADGKDEQLLKELAEALKEKEAAKGVEKAGKEAWGKGSKK